MLSELGRTYFFRMKGFNFFALMDHKGLILKHFFSKESIQSGIISMMCKSNIEKQRQKTRALKCDVLREANGMVLYHITLESQHASTEVEHEKNKTKKTRQNV